MGCRPTSFNGSLLHTDCKEKMTQDGVSATYSQIISFLVVSRFFSTLSCNCCLHNLLLRPGSHSVFSHCKALGSGRGTSSLPSIKMTSRLPSNGKNQSSFTFYFYFLHFEHFFTWRSVLRQVKWPIFPSMEHFYCTFAEDSGHVMTCSKAESWRCRWSVYIKNTILW